MAGSTMKEGPRFFLLFFGDMSGMKSTQLCGDDTHMGVSKNSGTPQIIHFNRVFHYKPSILGYPYFWKHPYIRIPIKQPVFHGIRIRSFCFSGKLPVEPW